MAATTASQMLEAALARARAGEMGEAETLCRRVLLHHPANPEALGLLATALQSKGDLGGAALACQQAIALRPDFAEAYARLGHVLQDMGNLDAAVAAFRRAVALDPTDASAYCDLGAILSDKGSVEGALAAYLHATALRPDFPDAWINLANLLRQDRQLEQAAAAYQKAILAISDAANPNLANLHCNLGSVLGELRRIPEALASFHRAIALDADHAEAHYGIAVAASLTGDLETGWRESQWRFKCRGFAPERRFAQPKWDGGDLRGRTILLHAEQGFGDTIQFIRYVPLVAGRGGNVVVEMPGQLMRLLRQVPGVHRWISRGEPLPSFDVHCPLMSLPQLFGTTLGTIPAQSPLLPERAIVKAWRSGIESAPSGLKVALAWAGNPHFRNDHLRSLSLSRLARLFDVPGVTFCSIQKGSAAQQAMAPPHGARLLNLSPQIADFADTAAAMSLMDLVITTDTSVAHLAGAMGRQVWVMLQYVPDWRWMLDREDSPWYPTMRFFRQPAAEDWETVIATVAIALKQFTNDRGFR